MLSSDLKQTTILTEYLNRVYREPSVKVIIYIGSPESSGREEYIGLFTRALSPGGDDLRAKRLCSALNEFVIGVIRSEKIVIAAASGEVITDFLGIVLACDHRIFAANTCFVNAHLELGLTPKGGAAFFLARHLGRRKAYEFLLSQDTIPVEEALRLGLVDDIVPLDQLEARALEVAEQYATCPPDSLAGLKSLVNYSLRGVEAYLDHENRMLDRITMRRVFPGS
jgi:2-(1,2-epoxy-1,2-dihydrophenyl)acetyl-CoA isomerase